MYQYLRYKIPSAMAITGGDDPIKPKAQAQGGGGDPYTNQYGKSAISLSQFNSEYSGCYENEIITGQSSKFGYTFPNKIAGNGSFVKLGNGREVDITHFMVVGRRGHLMGIANEITQIGTNSFFYQQDLYSNRLGVNFFNSYGSLINQNPSMISTYMYWFLSNPSNINFAPPNFHWEIGPKY
jgi:hypothetical protein